MSVKAIEYVSNKQDAERAVGVSQCRDGGWLDCGQPRGTGRAVRAPLIRVLTPRGVYDGRANSVAGGSKGRKPPGVSAGLDPGAHRLEDWRSSDVAGGWPGLEQARAVGAEDVGELEQGAGRATVQHPEKRQSPPGGHELTALPGTATLSGDAGRCLTVAIPLKGWQPNDPRLLQQCDQPQAA